MQGKKGAGEIGGHQRKECLNRDFGNGAVAGNDEASRGCDYESGWLTYRGGRDH